MSSLDYPFIPNQIFQYIQKFYSRLRTSNAGLLPPASEGMGKVVFSVCSHPGGGTPARSGWGVPQPGQDGGTPSRDKVSTIQSWGTPIQGWGTPPSIGQQMEYLICSEQYASCVHARGLSCLPSSPFKGMQGLFSIFFSVSSTRVWFILIACLEFVSELFVRS